MFDISKLGYKMSASGCYSAANSFLDEINVRALEIFEEREKDKLSSSVPDNDSSTAQSAWVFLQEVIDKVVTAISDKLSLFASANHQLSACACMDKQISGNCEYHSITVGAGYISSFISSGWCLEDKIKLEDETKLHNMICADSERCSLPAKVKESTTLSNKEGSSLLRNDFEDIGRGESAGLKLDIENQLRVLADRNALLRNDFEDDRGESAGFEHQLRVLADRNELLEPHFPPANDTELQGTTEGTVKVTFKPARELFEANSQENKTNSNNFPSPEKSPETGQFKSRESNFSVGDSNVSPSPGLHSATESRSCKVVESHRGSDIESIKEIRSGMKDGVLDKNKDQGNFVGGGEDQEVPGEGQDVNLEQTGNASLYDLNTSNEETEIENDPLGGDVTTDAKTGLVPVSYQWSSTSPESNNEVKSPADERLLRRVHPIPSCNRRRRVGLSRNQRVRPLHSKRLKMSEE